MNDQPEIEDVPILEDEEGDIEPASEPEVIPESEPEAEPEAEKEADAKPEPSAEPGYKNNFAESSDFRLFLIKKISESEKIDATFYKRNNRSIKVSMVDHLLGESYLLLL